MTTGLTPFQRLSKLLKADKKEISYIYTYAIFGGLINLVLPLGVQAILNLLQGGTPSSAWWLLIGVVTVGTLLSGFLVVMQLSASETLQRRWFTRVAFDFAERLPLLRTEAVRNAHLPELVNRFFDTLTIQKALPKLLMDGSTAIMQILFGVLLLSFYHPLFIFFAALLIICLILIFRLTGSSGINTSLKESKYKYEVAYWLEEIGRTIYTFKLAGKSPLPLQRTDELVSGYLDAKERHFRVLMIQFLSIVSFKTLTTFVLLTLGGWLVLTNQINIGQFVAAEIVVILISNAAEKLILTMENVYDVLTALDKIGHVADLPVESNKGLDFSEVNDGRGMRIRMENVSYQFGDKYSPVLKNINLEIGAGEHVCIAGYNGSGKTTLTQLISGFFCDFSGIMNYNDVPRNNFNQASLRAVIGDYSTNETIFKGTLLENITLGNPNLDFKRLTEIVEKVGLANFVSHLPEGYQTMLLPNGHTLPRSVIVKIILARAIIFNPKLLAIEEPFANLEYHDRVRIAQLLTENDASWTLVVVSDDPVLASRCDKVVIMRDGEIIQQGDFESIRNSPHFKAVFKASQQ